MPQDYGYGPGLYWHPDAFDLLGYCPQYRERVEDFLREEEKLAGQLGIRLRLFQPVRGPLPKALVKARKAREKAQRAHDKAWQVYFKAWQVYFKAWQVYFKAWQVRDEKLQAYDETLKAKIKTGQVYFKAWVAQHAVEQAHEVRDRTKQAYNKARHAYDKAWQALVGACRNDMTTLERLHAEQCPDCPWNGQTIFPGL